MKIIDYLAEELKAEQARKEGFVMEILEAPKGYFEENDHCRAKEEYRKLELARQECFFMTERANNNDPTLDLVAFVKHLETCPHDACH